MVGFASAEFLPGTLCNMIPIEHGNLGILYSSSFFFLELLKASSDNQLDDFELPPGPRYRLIKAQIYLSSYRI